MTKELFFSSILHLVFVAGLVILGPSVAKQTQTIVVFLTQETPGGGSGGGDQTKLPKESGRPHITPARAPKTPVKTSFHPPLSAASHEDTVVYDKQLPSPVEESTASTPISSREASSENMGVCSETGGGNGSGAGAGSGSGKGSGVGEGPGRVISYDDATASVNRWRKEHYAYISDLINKHMTYPPLARKLGWTGSVLVAFVILRDGHTQDIRIVKSSGYDVLDQSVMRSIRDIQPFPAPPAKAEISVPVSFRLSNEHGS